jgi:glycine/D-amino acid oxidase-like deaminating enzyme/nitrite reductase/ring-hydroxylating ferredoxin subunit
MPGAPEPKPVSFWIDTTPRTGYPPLSGDVAVDVAVLGAGITGLTAALLLKRLGKTVAVVEMGRIAEGVSGNTTAKVTSQHKLIYHKLIQEHGERKARLYAEANEAAIDRVEAFVEELGIDCDFRRLPAYVYTEKRETVPELRSEVEAARKVGLPASFVEEAPLPFPVEGAMKFEDQAQFHVRKYLLALAEGIPGSGSHVFEGTRALDVHEGVQCRVETDRGNVVARDVIYATHIPFAFEGEFWGKAAPEGEYGISARIGETVASRGTSISADKPSRSVRTARGNDGQEVLIVVGDGHKTGEDSDTGKHPRHLEEWARERFGVTEFENRWFAEDYYSVDTLPYVGRIGEGSEHVYVATGYRAWGMSNGTAAAMLLADMIAGRENEWLEMYDSTRATPLARGKLYKEGLQEATEFVGGRLGGPDDASAVAPGEGKVVGRPGDQTAVYRNPEGNVHAVSARCTHLGCIVSWNGAERSWDCPCHGSRFSTSGEVIHGPAVRDLEKKEV